MSYDETHIHTSYNSLYLLNNVYSQVSGPLQALFVLEIVFFFTWLDSVFSKLWVWKTTSHPKTGLLKIGMVYLLWFL